MSDSLVHFLTPAAMLFATGLMGAMFKRNYVVMFMSIELMLCASILAFTAFAAEFNDIKGAVFALFIMAVAAAEVAVGLAIITKLFLAEKSVSAKDAKTLGD